MDNYVIISDSSCDLPQNVLTEYNIDLVPYYVSFDSTKYYRENVDISVSEFYEQIIDKKLFPKTSLPPIQDYIDVFKKHLKNGNDILCICLSSKFSGSYQSAVNAKNILLEKFPHRKIEVVDSILATIGQGLLVYEAALMKKSGADLSAVTEKINLLKHTAKINFTVDSLEHLQKGGRIGKASALAGALLNIKPIIVMKNGELIPEAKIRGKKKAITTLVDMTVKELENIEDYHVGLLCCVQNESFEVLNEAFISKMEMTKEDIELYGTIGVTIGTHTGPTAIGITYIKKYNKI